MPSPYDKVRRSARGKAAVSGVKSQECLSRTRGNRVSTELRLLGVRPGWVSLNWVVGLSYPVESSWFGGPFLGVQVPENRVRFPENDDWLLPRGWGPGCVSSWNCPVTSRGSGLRSRLRVSSRSFGLFLPLWVKRKDEPSMAAGWWAIVAAQVSIGSFGECSDIRIMSCRCSAPLSDDVGVNAMPGSTGAPLQGADRAIPRLCRSPRWP